jgi:hypothetical protein
MLMAARPGVMARGIDGDESQLRGIPVPVHVSQPELAEIRQHLGDREGTAFLSRRAAHSVSQQADQRDTAEVDRDRFLGWQADEHTLRQSMAGAPAASGGVSFALVPDERPGRRARRERP